MNRTMSSPIRLFATWVDSLPAWILAVLGIFAAAYHVVRWYLDQRKKVDDKLAQIQGQMDRMRTELDDAHKRPQLTIATVREMADEITGTLAEAKAITASREPRGSSKPVDEGGYGE